MHVLNLGEEGPLLNLPIEIAVDVLDPLEHLFLRNEARYVLAYESYFVLNYLEVRCLYLVLGELGELLLKVSEMQERRVLFHGCVNLRQLLLANAVINLYPVRV